MGSHSSPAGVPKDLLPEVIEGGRGRALRAQLAARHPERPAEDIEEAVQAAATDFLAEGQGIIDPGAAYAWVRTTAHRILGHEAERRRREVAVDPFGHGLEQPASPQDDPARELLAGEDEADLAEVVRELSRSFSPRRRRVFALWAAGRRRPQIAAEVGVRERVVKRELLEIMEEGRAALARRAGGGCEQGEPLVTRWACGIAGTEESVQARLHLERCDRCSTFARHLDEWRQKAGALLPVPAVEATIPGLIGRKLGRAGEVVSSVRRQIFGGGTRMKEQAVSAGYGRTADPTPLAAIRPGAVAAVVAGCLAVGGGATYCARHGVEPLGAAANLIAGTQEEAKQEPTPTREAPEAPVVAPVGPPPAAEVPVYEPAAEEPEPEPAPTGGSQKTPAKAETETEAEPEPEEVTPPPEQSFEPASPDYPATESESFPTSSSSGSTTTTTPEAARPKAVPANQAPQFGGP